MPREPEYPSVTANVAASCRCTFTFHDCIEAFRNRGSTVTGASPAGRVVSIALTRGIDPIAVSGAREWRIAGRVPDRRRARFVRGPAIGRAQHRATVRRETPGHADARLEVPIVLLIDLVDVDADAHERRARRVEDNEPVIPLRGRDVPLVAHAEFEREVSPKGDVVLDEQAHGALVDHASSVHRAWC